MNKSKDNEIMGKQAGNIVRHMIVDVEQKMDAGMNLSAGPSSKEESEHLQRIREANKKDRK